MKHNVMAGNGGMIGAASEKKEEKGELGFDWKLGMEIGKFGTSND